jgi:BioD-like phosphotransacetylase family protein
MTAILYITSTQNFSGKSALCIGLLRRFSKEGYKVGYMKPVSTTASVVHDRIIDEDANFIKQLFDLPDELDTMVPVTLNTSKMTAIMFGNEKDLSFHVVEAFEKIIPGKDVVVLEGGGSLREGWIINLAPPQVIQLLKPKVLVVVPYDNDLQLVDDLITARTRLGDALIGAVVNRVPKSKHEFLTKEVKPFVESHDVPVFAILPEKQVLLSVSVAELNEGLMGEILCATQHVNELVEHLVVGAMNVESALRYFRQKPNQAVITGGDRPDIQLAALEASTRCLILTGNIRPTPQIISRAEEKGVPILLTRYDTMSTIEHIEGFFGKTRFHQEEKIRRFEELLNEYMDFRAIYSSLNLAD